MGRFRFAAFFVCTLTLASVATARADAGPTGSVALSLAPLIGQHDEPNSVTVPPPIPIPILQVDGRYHAIELFAESLPASPQIALIDEGRTSLDTHLTFFDAVVRAYDPTARFWAGAGEMIYNQSTTYSPVDVYNASRVVGGRYELGAGLSRDPARIRFWIDVMPGMNGNDTQTENRYSRSEAERATQFESQLAVNNAHGRVALSYGVRYVNYVAHFRYGGSLADKNVGFLPYATFAYRFGKP